MMRSPFAPIVERLLFIAAIAFMLCAALDVSKQSKPVASRIAAR